jgi:hypothetical protein
LGKAADAERMFEATIAIRQRALPHDPLALARVLDELSAARGEQGKEEDALRAHARALAILEETLGVATVRGADRQRNRPRN